ncbi:MAG TPA: hypothetical protein VHE30_19840 [Polyangiaceae bacterium]|nr:hypothetical protein [Polyangiaceae bacterium]
MDERRLIRLLLSFADPRLRVTYLESELLRMGTRVAAPLLDAVAGSSENGDAEAREALLSIAMVLANPAHHALVDALRSETDSQRLLSLDRLLRRAPPPSIAAPKPEEQPVPDYGRGRELTLGERKSLARRPDRRAFEKLCLDPHPQVLRQLLENPMMVEEDAIRIATLRPARRGALAELVQSTRWMARPRVRLSIILNPGTPPGIALPLVALCNREELQDVLRSTDTPMVLRGTAQELLSRRAPMPEDERRTLH